MKKILSKLLGLLFLAVIVVFFLKSQLGDRLYLPYIDEFLAKRAPKYEREFIEIDDYVRATPSAEEASVERIAQHLLKRAKTERERARAAFVWVTDRIIYDIPAYKDGSYKTQSHKAEDVLQRRKTVCEGFARLYLALCKAMNLKAEYVSGWVKGYNYRQGGAQESTSRHAWVVVEIEGKWQFVDPTFGQGSASDVIFGLGGTVNKKQFAPQWFAMPPLGAIYTHYPEDEKWQLQSPRISWQQWDALPQNSGGMLRWADDIAQERFDNALKLQATPIMGKLRFPLLLQKAPLTRALQAGKSYEWKFSSEHLAEVYVEEKGKRQKMTVNADGSCIIQYTPQQKGASLTLLVKAKNSADNPREMMSYKIE